ncbi:hypothetical protein [Mesorhizobium sp. M0040]|uniref:hypothetical protein n=1 Tax=Mesorhizobium sp. M0040 TaxID=2956855 RepID=UPI0033398D8F
MLVPADSNAKVPTQPAVEMTLVLPNLARARHLIFGSDDNYNVSHRPKKFDSCPVVRDNSSKSSDGVGDLPINSNLKVYHVVLACPVGSEYCRSACEISLPIDPAKLIAVSSSERDAVYQYDLIIAQWRAELSTIEHEISTSAEGPVKFALLRRKNELCAIIGALFQFVRPFQH